MTATVEKLEKALADSYTLYLKTQNYHWNIEGPQFGVLHAMFQEQYEDLAEAIDDIAENIRMLGEKSIGSMASFSKIASMPEAKEGANATEMLEDLSQSQVVMIETLQEAFDAAEEAGDEVVMDFLIQRMTTHRKNKWMLKSSV